MPRSSRPPPWYRSPTFLPPEQGPQSRTAARPIRTPDSASMLVGPGGPSAVVAETGSDGGELLPLASRATIVNVYVVLGSSAETVPEVPVAEAAFSVPL